MALGRREDAITAFDAGPAPANDDERFDRALQGALLGRTGPALTILNEYERGASKSYTSQAHAAMMYAAIGNSDRALELLEKDFREGDHVLWLYYRHDSFAAIRTHPRFVALLREMQLPLPALLGSTKSK
jgi:hypothetical protein